MYMQDLMIGRAKKAGFLALVWAISVVVLIATKGSNGTETTWDGLQALNDPRAMQIKDSLMNGMVPADSGLQGKYNLEGAICKRNPFLASIKLSETEMLSKYDSLVKQTAWDREQITLDPQTKHNHNRFRPFHTAVDCNPTCVGGECGSDTSKIVCGLNTLRSPCVVYSIGSNNDWSFELGVLKSTSCEVHTFDCTGDRSRFKVPPSNRLFFHYECLENLLTKTFILLTSLRKGTVTSKLTCSKWILKALSLMLLTPYYLLLICFQRQCKFLLKCIIDRKWDFLVLLSMDV